MFLTLSSWQSGEDIIRNTLHGAAHNFLIAPTSTRSGLLCLFNHGGLEFIGFYSCLVALVTVLLGL